MNISELEYNKEIQSLATELVSEAYEELKQLNTCRFPDPMEVTDIDSDDVLELINDSGRLNELVDGHQWVIYYAYNLDVISHSENDDYMVDNLGSESLAHALENGGLNGLHTAIAYWCMYADIQDVLNELDIQSVIDDMIKQWSE